jgi:hypothetical protein
VRATARPASTSGLNVLVETILDPTVTIAARYGKSSVGSSTRVR